MRQKFLCLQILGLAFHYYDYSICAGSIQRISSKKRNRVEIKLDSLGNEAFDLNAFCYISLPPILKDETTAGLDNK